MNDECALVRDMMRENRQAREAMLHALEDLDYARPLTMERQEAYKAAGVSKFDRERYDGLVFSEYLSRRNG